MCLDLVGQCPVLDSNWPGYTLGSFVFVLFAVCMEHIPMVILKRRVLPLTLGFEKKSKRVSPETVSNDQLLCIERHIPDVYSIGH